MNTSRPFRKKLLSASVASVVGLAASGPLPADTYTFDFSGGFTMLNSTGGPVSNTATVYQSFGYAYSWYGHRTPITGTMTYDTTAGTGTLTIHGFQFDGDAPNDIAQAHDVSIQAIGNGTCTNNDPTQGCQAGSLLLANMLFHWNFSNPDYAVSTVWDAQGLLNALSAGVNLGDVIQGTGAVPATDGTNFGTVKTPILLPLGPTPVAVTTWNTTSNGNPSQPLSSTQCGFIVTDPTTTPPTTQFTCAGVNPSGLLPLISDTIGASPIIGTGFAGFSPNFDIRKLTVTCKNGTCSNTPPAVFSRAPGPNATNVDPRATVGFTFTKSMQAATVAAAGTFTLTDGTGNPVAGAVSPTSGNATNFTFTPSLPLSFTTTYTATITNAATDVNSLALSGAPVVWSFTTAAPAVAATCTVVNQKPTGSNFTMLNASNTGIGGTNDVTYSFEINGVPIDITNPANLNTSESGTIFNLKISSPTPFFQHTWSAHDIRVFAPGDYTFDTTCTVAQIHAGFSASCGNPLPLGQTQRYLHMHVGAGQLGAHMLFDWNLATNIDVAIVWNLNAVWNHNPLNLNPPPALKLNALWDGDVWAGPAGLELNPNTTWAFVSTDPDGDGSNGIPMVDGPFQGFGANFNLGPTTSCQGAAPTPITVGPINSASATGCSISTRPSSITVFDRSDWLLVGGFLAWLGALRFRTRRTTKN